jgi:predicted PurR-regulated permease PerM
MAEHSSETRALPVDPGPRRPSFFEWLPWEKLLIWGLFLLAVYTLRHFFLIIFLTFLLSYSLRSFVMWGCGILSPDRERVWLERVLTVISFGLVILGFYGVGSYLGPRLVEQGQQLVTRVRDLNPDVDFKAVQEKVLGPFLFKRKYGDPEDEAFQEAFRARQEAGTIPKVKDYKAFHDETAKLRREYEAVMADALLAESLEQLGDVGQAREFEEWLVKHVAPTLYEKAPERYDVIWRAKYEKLIVRYGVKPIDELSDEDRERLICADIVDEEILLQPPESWPSRYRDDWKDFHRSYLLDNFRELEAYHERFATYYETSMKAIYDDTTKGTQLPPDYESFALLAEAYEKGDEEFSRVHDQMEPNELSQEERQEELYANFELEEHKKLTAEFMNQDLIQRLTANVGGYIDQGVNTLAVGVRDGLRYLFILPVQIALSLLLSLFISFDIPKIRRGIRSLADSRVDGFYQEIAPGLINFGRLIGRAFQAQGVIAIFNTLLTFAAIKVLGVQNEVFLCAIVFVCSFIPVLGVVLSSVPIAIVALFQQPGGDIWLALQATGAILIIHFIETSVLNPKILGEMLHLHPVLVLTVLAVGEHFFGVWGLLLGVPVTVYVIRCVILNTGIPGLIEPSPRSPRVAMAGVSVRVMAPSAGPADEETSERGGFTSESLAVPTAHEAMENESRDAG